jgi:uncharacterized coiled-coil DUF342 family protein
MIEHVSAMRTAGLDKYVDYLQRQQERLQFYENMKHIPEGKFMIEELRQRKEFARSMYGSIDPSSDKAMALLTLIQSYEREADEWLARIQNSTEKIAEILATMNDIRKTIAERKKTAGAGTKFVPD